jgi:hypothetical protein
MSNERRLGRVRERVAAEQSRPGKGCGLLYGLCTIALVCSTASCVPKHQSPRPESVTVYADSEGEVLHDIIAYRSAGFSPMYLTLVLKSNDVIYFTLFDQVVRSKQSLMIRAYGKLFAYRLDCVAGLYAPSTRRVTISTLPSIATVPLTSVERDRQRSSECSHIVHNATIIRKIGARWNGLLDPWQKGIEYVTDIDR